MGGVLAGLDCLLGGGLYSKVPSRVTWGGGFYGA